jgi:hypothetical protein
MALLSLTLRDETAESYASEDDQVMELEADVKPLVVDKNAIRDYKTIHLPFISV